MMEATYLAAMTGRRRGASVNVVSAVRCCPLRCHGEQADERSKERHEGGDGAAMVVERHLDVGMGDLPTENAGSEGEDRGEDPQPLRVSVILRSSTEVSVEKRSGRCSTAIGERRTWRSW
jgi:hypothetical protein